ncbi:MAG: LON peptidase substrate-binding domain-containing protein [Gammaproteobacteria bacterium]
MTASQHTRNNPFSPTFEALPAALPIFPLGGALLLPRQQLPLNIFEPRYLNMVFDALAADRNIGMIQPDAAMKDSEPPQIYGTGCAGRITAFNETDDGRLLINFTGVCRFKVVEELSGVRGYRRVLADWAPYRSDLCEPDDISVDFDSFEQTLKRYFDAKGLDVKWEALKQLPHGPMIDFLSMNLPFSDEEKQALLEAEDGASRAQMLTAVVEMGARDRGPPASGADRH